MRRNLILLTTSLLVGLGLLSLRKLGQDPDRGTAIVASLSKQQEELKSFWGHYHEATRLRTASNWDGAMHNYRLALSIDPSHEESLYYLGACLLETGRYGDALDCYRRLTQLNPRSPRALTQLGELLSSRLPGAPPPDFRGAQDLFERNSRINPEESGPFLRLGFLALRQGHLQRASVHFETAAGFRSPQGAFMAGYVRFLKGEHQDAIRFFNGVLETERREAELSGRGAVSEGDVVASGTRLALTPLQSAALQSRLFLFLAASGLGGYPGHVPADFRYKRNVPSSRSRVVRLREPNVQPEHHEDLVHIQLPGSGELLAYRTGREVHLEERNAETGIEFEGTAVDVATGDYDGDSLTDLFVLRWKRAGILYRNQGDGTFHDSTEEAHLNRVGGEGLSCLFFDYDRDGRVDLLVTRRAPSGQVAWSLLNPGEECRGLTPRLFRNQSNSRFREITEEAGLLRCYGTVEAAAADLDGDGWTDLVLANGGTEEDLAQPSVVLYNRRGQGFSEEFLPSFEQPDRALGARVRDGGDGHPEIHLDGVGVFRIG